MAFEQARHVAPARALWWAGRGDTVWMEHCGVGERLSAWAPLPGGQPGHHLWRLCWVVLCKLHGQRIEAALPQRVLLAGDVAVPLVQICLPAWRGRGQAWVPPEPSCCLSASAQPARAQNDACMPSAHPDAVVSGRAWNPNGLFLRHCLRSSVSLLFATDMVGPGDAGAASQQLGHSWLRMIPSPCRSMKDRAWPA